MKKYSRLFKFLSVLLCAATLISLVACGGNKNNSDDAKTVAQSTTKSDSIDPNAKYSPTITVTSVKSINDTMQKAIAKKSDVIDDNIWSKGYESDLGIKVNYLWTIPSAQMEQKLNVCISANDLPDIIPANATQFKLLTDSGVALDMTKIFNDYASSFTNEMMKADNKVGLSQATVGGKLMALPGIYGNIDSASMLWIRTDWLKSLGLQPPKTMADVFKISEAFTKSDPDKNGKNDTIGLGLEKTLFSTNGGITGFLEGYHAYCNNAKDPYIKDTSGNLVYGGIQPEIKTALSKLAEMYKDGQIDKEFGIKDNAKLGEDVAGGKIGMLYGAHAMAFGQLQNSKNKDPKSEWRPFPIVSIDDKPAKPMINSSASTFYVVNKKMKSPEAAVKLYNYFYAKDPAISKEFDARFHGINGEQETKPEQNQLWSVMLTYYPQQNLYIHQSLSKYYETKDKSLLENSWVKDNVEQNEKYLAGDNKLFSSYIWGGKEGAFSVINKYNSENLFIVNGYLKANTKSMMEKGATLKQLRDETFTKIIMGEAPIGEFDTYVDKYKKLGGDDIAKEVNAEK